MAYLEEDRPPADPIDELIASRGRSGYRYLLLGVCFSATLMDGVHVQTMGVVGPAVAREFAMTSSGMGILMAAAEFGFMLGALFLSPLTDRFGRKGMLAGSTLLFGLFSIATAAANGFPSLLLCRLMTGVGLGCAGPAVVSLATEYAPVHHRARIATLIWSASPAGSFIGGLLGSLIVPHYGWRTLFLAAGLLTIVFVALILIFVPESLRFLLLRAPHDPRIAKILESPGASDPDAIIRDVSQPQSSRDGSASISTLFRGDNMGFTTPLWLAFFLCFMCLLATLTWTVTILGRAGFSIGTASLIVACNNIGGTVGVASAGWALERFGRARLLFVTFIVGTVAVIGMGHTLGNLTLLGGCAAFTGLCIGGNTAGLIALAAERYPTPIRATGVGWGLAAGRFGGAVGPVLMGVVAGHDLSPRLLFAAIAIPAGLAAVVVLPLCMRRFQPALAMEL